MPIPVTPIHLYTALAPARALPEPASCFNVPDRCQRMPERDDSKMQKRETHIRVYAWVLCTIQARMSGLRAGDAGWVDRRGRPVVCDRSISDGRWRRDRIQGVARGLVRVGSHKGGFLRLLLVPWVSGHVRVDDRRYCMLAAAVLQAIATCDKAGV